MNAKRFAPVMAVAVALAACGPQTADVDDPYPLLSTSPRLLYVENPSDEQEFALQYLLARASRPGLHPLGVVSKRLFDKPLEQRSGDLTYAFSDFISSGRFAFEVHRGQETYDYHPMTIRDAAIKDAANREKNNPLLRTNSEIFSGYMNPYCQKYIAPETLKVEFSEKWVQQQFDGQGKLWKEHVYLWNDGQFQLFYQLVESEEGPLKLNEIGDRRWFEDLRSNRTF